MHTQKTTIWILACALLVTLTACTGPSLDDITAGMPVAAFEATDNTAGPAFEGLDDDCVVVGAPATEMHQAMFDALNEYRKERGLSELVYSRRLEAAANAHLQDLWDRAYFAHVTPEGLTPADRAMAEGFCHKYVGENLAAGQPTVERVMTAWDESPSHQVNMTEPDFVYVGMGYFVDPNTGRRYWAQVFAFDVP